MTDEIERRWDDAVEEAWTQFRSRVADRLAGLAEDDTLLVDLATPADDDGATVTPYCFVTAAASSLRVEAVSAMFFQLSDDQEQALLDLGFRPPSDEETRLFWRDVERREADRAAWMIVSAMRDVYGVMHPIYLDAGGLEPVPSGDEQPVVREVDEATRFPQSSEELLAAMQEVVGDLLGREAELDEDGDLPIPAGSTIFYATVSTRRPRILIHGMLVTDVVDEQRAMVEVNLLNKAEFGLTFVLADGAVTVRRELPMTAFVPSDVRQEIARIVGESERWTTDLLTRVGGRAVLGDEQVHQPRDRQSAPRSVEPVDERLAQALRVLRELEGEERGSVDPATMVRVFHGDRDLLLSAGRWAVSRSARWSDRRRKAEKEGKASHAKMCRAQQRYYVELRGRIRQALRSVVQAPAKRERVAQLSLFAEDEASA